jgi:hypothetical protein
VERHFIEKKQVQIFKEARELFRNPSYQTTKVNSVEIGMGLFELQEFQVTTSTVALIELVRRVLQDATKSSNYWYDVRVVATAAVSKLSVTPFLPPLRFLSFSCSATVLIRTARNVVKLFEFSVSKSKLESVPQISILFYNDCMYITHHLLTLGFQYQHRSVVKETR